jgi:hypothetical protein
MRSPRSRARASSLSSSRISSTALAAKQKLMELPDPRVRLELVDEFLRGQGVVK